MPRRKLLLMTDLEQERAFFEFARRAIDDKFVDEMLQRALDALHAVIPYDLATIFELDGDALQIRTASGKFAERTPKDHSLDLKAHPTIRRILQNRRAQAMLEHNHSSVEGDPFDDVFDFPHGHSCMVVPLAAAEHSFGVMTLDRATCGTYSDELVELADVFGRLLSMLLLFASQAQRLDRICAQLNSHRELLAEERGGASAACHRIESSRSPSMQILAQQAKQLASSDLPALIQGETGTGKEVLAEAIHYWSPRASRPFVRLNCAALPENLIESELFGHEKGAFSGADRARAGRFRTANGGTLLLDEIGDMPLSAQAKLLRVLQEGEFEPVGADRSISVDVRVIASSHVDLEKAVATGRFREDLYYRLAAFPLRLPPLRERKEDMLSIVEDYFQSRVRSESGPWQLSSEAEASLARESWPGNIRQLINTLERATIVRPAGVISSADLGLSIRTISNEISTQTLSSILSWEDEQRAYFSRALEACDGKVFGEKGAAALVGMKATTLQSRLKKLGLR